MEFRSNRERSGEGLTSESKEQPNKTEIVLHFMRHGEKENDKTKPDIEHSLTEKGKLDVTNMADPETDLTQAMAFGSPRKRTQETAGLRMAGAKEDIDGTETLEELNEKLNLSLKVGKKIMTDKRLDFTLPEAGSDYYNDLVAAFRAGKLLKFLVEESDPRIAELGVGPEICGYSNQASQIAEVVIKYFKILPRWEKLASDENKNYSPVMERFLGSHQSVTESFLAKIIETTKGKDERDAFVAALGDGGFDFAEGFKVEIVTDNNGEEKAHIYFKKEKDDETVFEFNEWVGRDIIEGLIINKD